MSSANEMPVRSVRGGVAVRLARLIGDGRPYFLAADDALYSGPRGLLRDPATFAASILHSAWKPRAVLCTAGFANQFLAPDPQIGRVLALTYSSPDNVADKRVLQSVDHAIACGADVVAVHISLCCPYEQCTVAQAATLAEAAHSRGFPVLIAAYARSEAATSADRMRAIRVAVELGADIVKSEEPRSPEEWADTVATLGSARLVIGGGPACSDHSTFALLSRIGAMPTTVGFCLGRRVLMSPNADSLLKTMSKTARQSPLVVS